MKDANSSKPLLSFAIPTYNRPEAVSRLLKSLLPQLSPEVEVVIRDDSSDGATEKIAKELFENSGKTSQLSYFKGEKLGMDKATLFVVENSKGEYVWTFGDDDELLPGALDKLLGLLKANPDVSFVWANYMCPEVPGSENSLGEERFFRNSDEALMTLTNKMTLLSTFIFKKEKAMRAWPIAQKHIGSWWSIMALVFESVSCGGKVYFLKGPYVLNHLEAHGENVFELGVQVFGINLARVLVDFRGKFSRRAMRKFLGKHFGDVWRGILVNRARYSVTLSMKMIGELFSIYKTYPEFYVALPFFLMPRFIVRFFYKLYKLFFDHRKFRFGISDATSDRQ